MEDYKFKCVVEKTNEEKKMKIQTRKIKIETSK